MTDRRTHPRHHSQPLHRRAFSAPLIATGTVLAAAATGLAVHAFSDDAPGPAPVAFELAFVDRPDRGQADTSHAQAFADQFAAAFADYLAHPERTRPLIDLGVDRDALTPTNAPKTNRTKRGRLHRADQIPTGPADGFTVSSVNARRTRSGWLLSASISIGRGPDRSVVPLVASARRTTDGFRVTSLNARAGAE